MTGAETGPTGWLVVIDVQTVFADPGSPWAAPGFDAVVPVVRRLVEAFTPRVVFTRFVAPQPPRGAWVPYYQQWPFALVPPEDPLYDLVPGLGADRHRVVTRTTFGKWGPDLAAATGGGDDLVLAGVSTDCCVLSTALAAADAGSRVRVVADGCAGASPADHQRALDAMALYAPLVEVTDARSVIG